MSTPGPKFWSLFSEVFTHLPRQGPGNRACVARAISFCSDLPESPRILDLGCGVGQQTMHLVEMTNGSIVAIDIHGPNIARLEAAVKERNLHDRVRPLLRDFTNHGQDPGSFHLVWSEGALYNIGIETAMPMCRDLLVPGGYVAFTDAVWRTGDPPAEVVQSFSDYPTMGSVPDVLTKIQRAGLSVMGHFTLPDEAWWDDFYTPMELQIEELRAKYVGDAESMLILDQIAAEPKMHRNHSQSYAYEFFVAQRQR
jgi:SAM-dependent methyltransferase